MKKQVNKNHYQFSNYSTVRRWISYFHQLNEVISQQPESVLEIGVGEKVFGNYIKSNTSIKYSSLDIAKDLKPDILGDILNIPLKNNSYDVVVAFEVLEHIPFEDFEKVLSEMKRVAKKNVVISIPHFGPPLKLSFKIPLFKEVKFFYKIPYHPKHEFNGQYYWEIGKRGYSVSRIKNILRKQFVLEKDYLSFENPFHHFFVLRNKDI